MESWQFFVIMVTGWFVARHLEKKIDANWELLIEIKSFLGIDEEDPRYD